MHQIRQTALGKDHHDQKPSDMMMMSPATLPQDLLAQLTLSPAKIISSSHYLPHSTAKHYQDLLA
jgi:hypothetical protein